MDKGAGEKLITAACGDIAQLATAVNGLAQGAASCSAGGNTIGAVGILLEIEPHLGEMQRLLDIASFARRTMNHGE